MSTEEQLRAKAAYFLRRFGYGENTQLFDEVLKGMTEAYRLGQLDILSAFEEFKNRKESEYAADLYRKG